MAEIDTWWMNLLNAYERDGWADADKGGPFNPPHPGSDDPQDQDENLAYQTGFNQRRRELGKCFRWN